MTLCFIPLIPTHSLSVHIRSHSLLMTKRIEHIVLMIKPYTNKRSEQPYYVNDRKADIRKTSKYRFFLNKYKYSPNEPVFTLKWFHFLTWLYIRKRCVLCQQSSSAFEHF